MNVMRVVVLVVAVVAAGLAAILARGLLTGNQRSAVATPGPSVPMTQVLVASHAINLGTKVTSADLKWQAWPREALDASYITREAQPQAQSESDGRVARVALLPGEPVTASKIVEADGAGFMAAALTPGKRAIAIKINEESGAGGFILPNDRVDVILTQERRSSSTGGRRFVGSTILRNVRVLAIGQTYTGTGEEDAPSVIGKTATLELSPEEAEGLALAGSAGELSLSLVSLQNPDGEALDRVAAEARRETGSSVQIIRYGVQSTVSSGN